MPQATRTVSVQRKNRVGMVGRRPCLRLVRSSWMARRPRVWVGSSFMTKGRRTRADVLAGSGSAVLGLRDLPDHEADVRIARERRRLEHALHDERRHHLIDLEDADTGERLARAALGRLPQLALRLQDVEELVDAL